MKKPSLKAHQIIIGFGDDCKPSAMNGKPTPSLYNKKRFKELFDLAYKK